MSSTAGRRENDKGGSNDNADNQRRGRNNSIQSNGNNNNSINQGDQQELYEESKQRDQTQDGVSEMGGRSNNKIAYNTPHQNNIFSNGNTKKELSSVQNDSENRSIHSAAKVLGYQADNEVGNKNFPYQNDMGIQDTVKGKGVLNISADSEPVKTDSIWAVAFSISLCVTLILSVLMILLGDPKRLSVPADPDGRVCGLGDLREYPYIYFVTPSKEYMYRSTCVKECPQLVKQPELGSELKCAVNSVVESCKFHILKGESREKEVLIYDTKVYLEKVCMPRNVEYFSLVLEAMHIGKWQSALSNLRESSLPIFIFTIIAAILSYATKFSLNDAKLLPLMIKIFFTISAVGFLLLGLFFLSRTIFILTTPPPDAHKVIEEDSVLLKSLTSTNSSALGNGLVTLICLATCIIFIRLYTKFEWNEDRIAKRVLVLRNEMILLISDVIHKQQMIWIPIYSMVICFLLFIFFFFVQTNVYAVFSPSSSSATHHSLPFEQNSTSIFATLINIFIIIGFSWAFLFVIHAGQFISIALSSEFIEIYLAGEKNENKNALFNILKDLFKYRKGTIAKSALLTLPIYHIRAFLEMIDTSYQYNQQRFRTRANPSSQPYLFRFQKWISTLYRASGLKGITPYGFILTKKNQMEFMCAGEEMQRQIDSTSEWFEDMLDSGELFESQIEYSITFIITFFFYIVNFLLSDGVASTVSPTVLMVISSFIVSMLYIGTYGSVYSSFILTYIILSEKDETSHEQQSKNSREYQIEKLSQLVQKVAQVEYEYNQNPTERPNAGK